MANVTLYLSDELEAKARKAAKSAKTSLSKFVALRLEESMSKKWPQEFLDAAGSCPDIPDLDPSVDIYGPDAPREKLD